MKARLLSLTVALAAPVFIPLATAEAAGAYTVLHNFAGHGDGRNPAMSLVADQDGNLYGTTFYGGHGTCGPSCGVVFQLVPPTAPEGEWTENIIYRFNLAHGYAPSGALAMDDNGVLYGTTEQGGDVAGSCGGCGVVYRLKPPAVAGGAWKQQVLYEFELGGDGNSPSGGVVLGADGVLYGTASQGGNSVGDCVDYGCGVVFALTPPATKGAGWTESPIFTFSGADGNSPMAGLLLDASGTLYGTTYYGGSQNAGTVFALMPPTAPGGAWTEDVLHSFLAQTGDGYNPQSTPVIGAGGVLYASTERGGIGGGTVFELTPPAITGGSWGENVLYAFEVHAGGPQTGVVRRKNGVLYGTTYTGGTKGGGTVFSLMPPTVAGDPWSERVLHSFQSNHGRGSIPSGLFLDNNEMLFGTTFLGGTGPCHERHEKLGCGTIFELQP